MKEWIANLVYWKMALAGLRTFKAQFLVSFILIFVLLIGTGAGLWRNLATAPAKVEDALALQVTLHELALAVGTSAAGGSGEDSLTGMIAEIDSGIRALPGRDGELVRRWNSYRERLESPGDGNIRAAGPRARELGRATSQTLEKRINALRRADERERIIAAGLALVLLAGTLVMLVVGRIYGNFHFMDQVERLRGQLLQIAERIFRGRSPLKFRKTKSAKCWKPATLWSGRSAV